MRQGAGPWGKGPFHTAWAPGPWDKGLVHEAIKGLVHEAKGLLHRARVCFIGSIIYNSSCSKCSVYMTKGSGLYTKRPGPVDYRGWSIKL